MQASLSSRSPALPTPEPLTWLAPAALALVGPAVVNGLSVPSTTFLNQAVALAGWGLLLLVLPYAAGQRPLRATAPVLIALAVMALAALLTPGGLSAHASLNLSAAALMGVAALSVVAGASAASLPVFALFSGALLAAGLVGLATAAVQHFGPEGMGSPWIASTPAHGRAGGNLRQPNHLSSLLLQAMVGALFLTQWLRSGTGAMQTAVRRLLPVAMLLLLGGVVLTASRTGAVCVVLMALWGLLDRRLSKPLRLLLLSLPLLYVAWWFALGEWAHLHHQSFAGEKPLRSGGDISSSRFAIWSNTLALIAQNPWTGVGWGEFNFAWTLTAFPDRPVAFFDHTHNLVLQLWVELGLPLGTAVLALLLWGYARLALHAWRAQGVEAVQRTAVLITVTMIGVHSLLEYPLWYAYFLLPTAFAWGVGLAPLSTESAPEVPTARLRGWRLGLLRGGAALLAAGAVFAVLDYVRVVHIFAPPAGATSLDERIRAGQRGQFFAHHAHYAAATTHPTAAETERALRSATHFLLDARLMMAWARSLHAAGEVDKARWIAARLREFRNPAAASFFAVCDAPPAEGERPFQCEPPQRSYSFRDFR